MSNSGTHYSGAELAERIVQISADMRKCKALSEDETRDSEDRYWDLTEFNHLRDKLDILNLTHTEGVYDTAHALERDGVHVGVYAYIDGDRHSSTKNSHCFLSAPGADVVDMGCTYTQALSPAEALTVFDGLPPHE